MKYNMLFVKLLSVLVMLLNVSFGSSMTAPYYQEKQVIYALNESANTNIVKLNQEVKWPPLKRVQSSYVIIKQKTDGTFYIQVTIRGQFAYGGIFKYIGKEGNDYKYHRTDGTADDYLYVNYQLTVLSSTQQYDERITMTLLNFQTSFGLLMKF
jgi:hypothetical protein